jgi:hypothetical protein
MPEAHAFDAALTALAPHMQAEAGRRARINVLRLAPGTGCVALAQAVTRLAEQRQNGPRGAVLDLGWAGDGTRAQAD